MSKQIPMRKLLKLVDEVQETLERSPSSGVEFLLRGRFEYDGDGEVGIGGSIGAPGEALGVDAKVEGGYRRHWTAVGLNEFVLRVYRPAAGERTVEQGE